MGALDLFVEAWILSCLLSSLQNIPGSWGEEARTHADSLLPQLGDGWQKIGEEQVCLYHEYPLQTFLLKKKIPNDIFCQARS